MFRFWDASLARSTSQLLGVNINKMIGLQVMFCPYFPKQNKSAKIVSLYASEGRADYVFAFWTMEWNIKMIKWTGELIAWFVSWISFRAVFWNVIRRTNGSCFGISLSK